MSSIQKILASCLALTSSACSVYPVSEDRTGYDTADIIAEFRCNLSYAIRRNAISYLREQGNSSVYPGYTGIEIAEALEFDREKFDRFQIERFYPKYEAVLKYYKQAVVGYDFTLQAIEDNTQSAGFGATRTINRRVDTIGALGSNQVIRDVSRNFRLRDDFFVLSRDQTYKACKENHQVNIEFPLTGGLPLDNLVRNFLFANEQKNLQGDSASPAIPRMADTIIFTTKLAANFDPSFDLAPAGLGFLLKTATFKFDNIRTDKHTVIVAITVPPRLVIATRNGPVGIAPPKQLGMQDVNSALNEQRDRNVQNAIIQIGNSINRLPF